MLHFATFRPGEIQRARVLVVKVGEKGAHQTCSFSTHGCVNSKYRVGEEHEERGLAFRGALF